MPVFQGNGGISAPNPGDKAVIRVPGIYRHAQCQQEAVAQLSAKTHIFQALRE